MKQMKQVIAVGLTGEHEGKVMQGNLGWESACSQESNSFQQVIIMPVWAKRRLDLAEAIMEKEGRRVEGKRRGSRLKKSY